MVSVEGKKMAILIQQQPDQAKADGLLRMSSQTHLYEIGLPALSLMLAAHCLRTNSLTLSGIGT